MTGDARGVVDTYFDAWKNNDFATMRSVLDDKLDFAGPIDAFDNADAYQHAIQGLSQMKTDIVVHKTFVDGPDVLTWYDLHTRIAPPAPVAEWSHVEGGKITMVRVVFDARPFAAAARSTARRRHPRSGRQRRTGGGATTGRSRTDCPTYTLAQHRRSRALVGQRHHDRRRPWPRLAHEFGRSSYGSKASSRDRICVGEHDASASRCARPPRHRWSLAGRAAWAPTPEHAFQRHNGHEWGLTTTHSPMKRGDASVYRFVFVSLMMVVLVVASNGGAAIAASRSLAQAQAAPIVTELPTTATSHPWIAWAPLSNGYVEQEFRFRGMAGIYAYTSAPPPPWDLRLQDMQPYATRMLVRRPPDPAAFNGTVVVEWLNVTSGYDVDPVWSTVAQYFLRSGYAWVGVSAQAAGVEAVKKWDPQRYGDLNIADDGQSYEIFSQAAQALRQPGSRILGGLPIQQIIGTGVSQSAMRLVPYINAFHPLAHVYDGYFVHSRGRGMPPINGVGVFSDLERDPITSDVPTLVFQTEGDLMAMDYAPARQPDTDMVRTWEVAGAAHVGRGSPLDLAISGGVRSRDTGSAAGLGNPACQANPFPSWPVADAAWDHLRTWISDGTPPPSAPLIQLTHTPTVAAIPPGDSNALVARDDMGNALGGIRTPAIDAPVGAYYGTNTCNPAFLGFLSGWYVPFDAATLAKLYPTHDAYVTRVTASATKAVADGFMLQDDAQRLINEADASSIGKLGPTITP